MSKGKSSYLKTPAVLIGIILGMTMIITAMMIAVVGLSKENNFGDDTAHNSSGAGAGNGALSSGDTLPSPSSATSQNSSTASSRPTVSSDFQVPVTTGLPVADKDPFKDTTPDSGKVCYLTFDDGPCANTDKILKILEENDVKATFFVVGTMATGKIKDIYNAGHAVGLHTGTHELSELYDSPEAFIKDLKAISDKVYEKIGIRSNLTRFPGGSATAAMSSKLGKDGFETVTELMEENGYTYFDWNIDSGDTHSKSPSSDYVMNEIRKGLKNSKGEYKSEVCILMHDIKNVTVETLPQIIKELKDLGYTFKTLDGSAPSFQFR